MSRRFNQQYCIHVRRSSDSLLLGVMKGFAEHWNFSVFWTRILGAIILLSIVGFVDGHGVGSIGALLAAGFFYLLLAMFMDPSEEKLGEYITPNRFETSNKRHSGTSYSSYSNDPSFSEVASTNAAKFPDVVALEKQLDSINRRIA